MSNKWIERLIVTAVVAIIIAILSWTVKQDDACTAKGGVYLSREGKCVAGLREIK